MSAVLPTDVGTLSTFIDRRAIARHDDRSVRLAVCFLQPWFQKCALKDLQWAVDNVSELAYIIACWPGQWLVREHTAIWDLIQAMVHIIGEEVRDAQRTHALN